MNRTNLTLLLILIVAAIFRFYRLWDFQFWSVDEEIFVAVVRQIAVDHKLILLSPNVAIGISLGSFFHLLSAPLFLLGGLTASKILIAGSALGVITTLVIYKTGKAMLGLKAGQIAALLYGSSFLVAFSDRRWWPLSLDPLLAVLSVFAMFKIINKDYKYSLLFAVAASFSWHADPSLSVILVFAFLSWIIFRLPLFNRQYLPAVTFLVLSLLPFLIFELRHPGAISHPIFELVERLSKSGSGMSGHFSLIPIIQGFARSLAISPSGDIEKYFMYAKSYPAPLFSPISELLALFFIAFPLFKKSSRSLIILYLYLLAFAIGIAVFTLGMKSEFHQHYFVIVWPVFFLLAAVTLSKLPKIVMATFLMLFVFFNAQTLALSNMRYPLVYKEHLVESALKKIGTSDFALRVQSTDRRFEGFGGLFFLKNKFPSNLDYYYAWDWIYRAYSLYEIQPSQGPFSKIILVKP